MFLRRLSSSSLFSRKKCKIEDWAKSVEYGEILLLGEGRRRSRMENNIDISRRDDKWNNNNNSSNRSSNRSNNSSSNRSTSNSSTKKNGFVFGRKSDSAEGSTEEEEEEEEEKKKLQWRRRRNGEEMKGSKRIFFDETKKKNNFGRRFFSSFDSENDDVEKISITFLLKNGEQKTVRAPVGVSVLDVAHHFNIDLEGACESSMACSTCHVILDEFFFDKLELPCEQEDDMLDMAPCLCNTSRLGCQVILSKELDGMTIRLPNITRNFYVDGHTPKPH